MKFFTAAFHEAYQVFLLGLKNSFARYSPDCDLTVFALSEDDVRDLVKPYGDFYMEGFQNKDNNRWARVNVFKIPLFFEMAKRFPGETLCWIDCDMLVLDDLSRHVEDGIINALHHGNRPTVYDCGDGLYLHPRAAVLGGLYALPPNGALNMLHRFAMDRPQWKEPGTNSNSGDLVLINHLVSSGIYSVRYIDDHKDCIFNFETQSATMHPWVREPRHREITLEDGAFMLDGCRISVFCFTGKSLVEQYNANFPGFRDEVRTELNRLYQ